MGSWVGPDVTIACLPFKGPFPKAASVAATISKGSAMRPGPYSPHAISPSFGPTVRTPSLSNVARFRCVAGWVHIRTFIEGAVRTRLSVANRTVDARSLATPFAIFDTKSAVAGATTIRSAARDNSICPISASSVRLNRSSKTFSPVKAETLNGVTNSDPAFVRTAVTFAPRSRYFRIKSKDL